MSETASLSEIAQAIVELRRRDEVISMVRKKLEAGASAREILVNDLIPGLREVGRKFEEKEYFLADMLYSAITMNECMKVLEPHLLKEVEKAESAGKIVLGTVAGDIHDIGKNLFATLARAAGFEVYDLGVDVSASKFVEKVKEVQPDIVAMSALLPTTAPYFKVVVEELKKAGLRDKVFVLIGGPPLVTAQEVGADAYTNDAFVGVKIAQEYVKKKRGAS
ncbi:MAG: cobalamin-binding protein [Candidatus Methanomethylicota archaeon]|uniref:Cobalamin-binding protein n=1 Tax=Thermoproteota archaeon TaxID=2056631 RepID=A0A497ERD0_9CREN|nr:MAG: cobalamin-binding protein [Candidatus Verstraetearchaeota archaeon]